MTLKPLALAIVVVFANPAYPHTAPPVVAPPPPAAAAAVAAAAHAGNVIFFHPDGYGLSHWDALRTLSVGPDGRLHWDRLPYTATYTGHMRDGLTATSHGGATTHAYGVKVVRNSFGLDGHQAITALSGKKMSIMEEALEAGFATALIQTGSLAEPGTAAFVASVQERENHDEIARQVIESGVDVILGGGEAALLPAGVMGRHGAGGRGDGLNLIQRAEELGYTVVYTREELRALPPAATKVLGVFAHGHTFNEQTEEALRAAGLPLYQPTAPTVAEMSRATLEILSRNPKTAASGFFIVAEEEGTDNFTNATNARGSFEAGRRADEALGVFREFVRRHPRTLLLTAADSNAGGKNIGDWPAETPVGAGPVNSGPDGQFVLAPFDGVDGAGTLPFVSAPDKSGNRFPFAVSWVRSTDVAGDILVRAEGLNAERIRELGVVDNTDIYRLMYLTLFGRWLPEERATLLGRAIIPADTFVDGPTSGQYIGSGPFFGRVPPFANKQPVQGISAILPRKDGLFLAMSDNGFGAKANSSDYLLTVYRLRPDFRQGKVAIEGFIRLSDPNRQINFPIQNAHTAERYLTGADFDLESFQIAPDGTFWFGDELGPFLLQTDAQGVALRAPILLPGVQAPENPFLAGEANLPSSGGFEGMALSADGTRLFPMLERELADDAYPDRRFIYEFDLRAGEFTGRKWSYRVAHRELRIGELIAIGETEFLVIERDGEHGAGAKCKRLFRIDIGRLDAGGFVHKAQVADLLNIADPNLISLPGREGDIGLGETFRFPFLTIEAVAIIDSDTLVIANDNNFPFNAGRNPHHPDGTEIIKIRLPRPLR